MEESACGARARARGPREFEPEVSGRRNLTAGSKGAQGAQSMRLRRERAQAHTDTLCGHGRARAKHGTNYGTARAARGFNSHKLGALLAEFAGKTGLEHPTTSYLAHEYVWRT